MFKRQVFDLMSSYKKSSAFLAAYDVGLFKLLHDSALNLEEISNALKLNKKRLFLLLLNLKDNGLVYFNQDKRWGLTRSVNKNYSFLEGINHTLLHEMNIFEKYMYPKKVVECLRCLDENKEVLSDKDLEIYDEAMYGENLKVIVLHVFRQIKKINNLKILSFGFGGRKIQSELSKLGLRVDPCSYNFDDDILQTNTKYDVVILHNFVHYRNSDQFSLFLDNLKNNLHEKSLIIVVDFFYEGKNEFLSGILIDWLTHGGLNFITKSDFTQVFEDKNFEIFEEVYIESIFTYILTIRGRSNV